MLKKQAKLVTSEIIKLKNEGKRVHTTLFSVTVSPASSPRFSVIISKKVYKGAVERNRARRKVFASIEEMSNIKPGMYYISIKKPINLINNQEIKADLKPAICLK